MSDRVISIVHGVGEIGIDTEASPGNGQYYVKHYRAKLDFGGFSSKDEALDELMCAEEIFGDTDRTNHEHA